MQQSKANVDELVADIRQKSQEAATNGLIDKEKYVIPPHLHDLQEADLPETQRGLVISEIAQFRERAAKREREKMRDNIRDNPPLVPNAPSGPKVREWGKPQGQPQAASPQQAGRGSIGAPQGYGKGAQGYSKPVGFVKAEDGVAATGTMGDERQLAGKTTKTDEELEAERKEGRRREEDDSFRDVRTLFSMESTGCLTQISL
jgi:RNA-binding protein 25